MHSSSKCALPGCNCAAGSAAAARVVGVASAKAVVKLIVRRWSSTGVVVAGVSDLNTADF